MTGFDWLINQERPIRILTTLLKNRTLPHALLFTGTAGVGKQAAALALAMVCNCQGETSGSIAEDGFAQDAARPALTSCGVCKSCRKIVANHHPDVIHVQPRGPFIKIEQIRALLQTLSMKPYEAKMRVVIISEAHCMNAAASNALLKILEEPPDRSMLVLIANHKTDLLPTIASRCQPVQFNRIATKQLASWIVQEAGLSSQTAEIIAAMANGSPRMAQVMIDENWLLGRNWLIAELQRLSLQPMARLFALAEKLAREKESLAARLEIIKSWFRDLIINQYDDRKIINQDVTDQIKAASGQTDLLVHLSKLDAVQKIQGRLKANTNLRLSMERLLIKLAQQ
ncbi:MAG: DNA polymerase III subunit delta' [Desulfobacterales bacterium]